MRRFVLGALSALTLAWAVSPARGAVCPGDCDANEQVQINELVVCVSIALGTTPLATCSPCDVDGSGMVTINELVAAVNAALVGCNPAATVTPGGPTPTPTTGMAICGNGVVEADEDCDPPNVAQADPHRPPCAANCTTETRRMATLDPTKSLSPIQTLGGVLATLPVSGTQVLTTGRARDEAVFGPGTPPKQLFAAGEAPIAIKAEDVKFDPVNVLGLACACVRGIAVPSLGDGISGVGVAGCGDQGLTDIDFLVEEDHDTTPGSPGNSGSGPIADDADCSAHSTTTTLGGTLAALASELGSDACLEGKGETCSGLVGTNYQYSTHEAVPSCLGGTNAGATCAQATDCPGSNCTDGTTPGMLCTTVSDCENGTKCQAAKCKTGTARPAACNSPRVYTFSGGHALRGSVLLLNSTSQTLLPHVAIDACKPERDNTGKCTVASFGADCLPCTNDDSMIMAAMVVPTTSGTASIKIYDANDNKGSVLGDGQKCGTKDCIGRVSGALADCDALKNNPNAPLSGALVTASPTVDSQVGDVVLTTTLQAQVPAP
jgi:hypothetical protein